MRILMLASNWPPAVAGGAEVYAARLANELRGAGHDVGAVTLGLEGEDVVATVAPRPHRLDRHAAASSWAKAWFHGNDLLRRDVEDVVRGAIRDFRPDVVHSHVVTGMSVRALTAPTTSGVAHVHTLHDHWLRCLRSTGTRRSQRPCGPVCAAARKLRQAALREHRPDIWIAISSAIGRDHHHLDGTFRVLPHPADVMPRSRSTQRRVPPVFGFLGQLNPNKGVGVLLAAAERLAPSAARFVVAGAGRLSADVAARSMPGLESWGWVAGSRREAFFDAIDCLVVPSLWQEPAGLVAREAAARGLPVIASDVGGLAEYVPSSSRPLLFPPGDADALVERIRRFAADPAPFAVDPSEIPTWDDHLGQLLEIYAAARSPVPTEAL